MRKLYHIQNGDTRIFHCAYTITQASISAVSRLLRHAGECPSWTLCALMLLLCLTVHLRRRYSELSVQQFRFSVSCRRHEVAVSSEELLRKIQIVLLHQKLCVVHFVRDAFFPHFDRFRRVKPFPSRATVIAALSCFNS